jgi:DNA end-binding protein Ku
MAPRANWKGFLKLAELTCPVALYTAASTSERIAFHTLNRETGNRVQRRFVDEETGNAVSAEDQVKGYEIAQGQYVMLDPEEVAAAVPESDKTLAIENFIPCDAIDDVYFDRPYYLAPSSASAEEAFVLLREGMRKQKVVALARAVLFRRVRTLLIRAFENGLVATTLHFDYEVRSADTVFSGIAETKIEGEMLDLAKHIIATKHGNFDPRQFKDRYEAALIEMVRAKQDGEPIAAPKAAASSNVIDLMEALRQSAGVKGSAKKITARKEQASKTKASKTGTSKIAAHKSRAGAASPYRKPAAKKKAAAKPLRSAAASSGRRRKQG